MQGSKLEYLKQKQCQIYCLQDTHFTPGTDETLVRARWGNDCYFSSFKSNSRGVAILFNKILNIKYTIVYLTLMAIILILDVTIDKNKRITLVTIYGPNHDVSFYQNIAKNLKKLVMNI